MTASLKTKKKEAKKGCFQVFVFVAKQTARMFKGCKQFTIPSYTISCRYSIKLKKKTATMPN